MITKTLFGNTESGEEVYAYKLSNCGCEAVILGLGGIIQSLRVKNRAGGYTDVALGYDGVSGYEKNGGYLGALIGRYANRICRGEFTLNGKKYILYKNNGNNHLHGGKKGYDKRIWQCEIKGESLILTLHSPDNEEGYPADLDIKVTYLLNEGGLSIEYYAVSGGDTPVNLTNHCYFNLKGEGAGDILSHSLKINADNFLPTDGESIPTGEIKSVEGTPFDFREYKKIGKDIDSGDIGLIQAKGYDHNFCLGQGYKKACGVYCEESGISMEVFTDCEGVQLYTGNYLNGVAGKGGKLYQKRSGFCLETQSYPDSPNKPEFPSAVLKKGEIYRRKTVYKFSVI